MRSSVLSLALLLSSFTTSISAANSYNIPDAIQDGNILHCFNWSMNQIKEDLPQIAAAGFGAVQISPIQRSDANVGSEWHNLYRPYDIALKPSTGIGTSSQLKSLCEEAQKYGIKIIVDVVANHVDKTSGYHDSWWDSSGRVRWEGGINYGSRYSITHGQLGDYGDVNSEDTQVIARAKTYIQTLKDLGVSGIRWDAAKHIGLPSEGCGFWTAVTSIPGLWHYGEILDSPGPDASIIKEYTNYMSVTDNRYCNHAARDNGGIPSGYGGDWAVNYGCPADRLVYWAESHDNYSNDEWSQNVDQAVIDRAYAAYASRNGVCALYLSRPNKKGFSNIRLEKGSTAYQSKHIAEVNKFRNAMAGKKDWFTSDGNSCVITRENGGAVIVRKGSGNVSVTNGGGYCPTGTYVDKISGSTFTVTSSTISGNVGSTGIAVIYKDNQPAEPCVNFSPNGGTFSSETLTVTATLSNATSGWIKIAGGTQQTFTGSKSFVIGDGISVGTNITIAWSATGTAGTKSGSVTFSKVEPSKSITVYYNNPDKWSKVNCYAYNDDVNPTKENAAWPGASAAYDADLTVNGVKGWWKYDLPDDLSTSCKVIFNNGTNSQYPAQNQPGLAVSGKSMALVGTTWTEATINSIGGGNEDNTEMPNALYIIGTISQNHWNTSSPILMIKNGAQFVAENVTLDAAEGDKYAYFTFVTTTGSSWDVINQADRYGSESKDTDIAVGQSLKLVKYPVNVSAMGANSWRITPGKYRIVADFKNNIVKIDNPNFVDTITDIENIEPLYFNLHGQKIKNPGSGIYIVKRGQHVSKEIIR